jgi:glycosyltransferase involved in cell wall biosynthesis
MNGDVVYWNNIPSPYMVERFNEIARRDRVRLEAWFSKRTEPDRSWEVVEARWEFRYRYLPRLGNGENGGVAVPTPLSRGKAPELLVCLHAEPAFLLGWALARTRGTRTVVWVLPTYDAWVRRRAWKESLKERIFPHIDAIITTGRDGRDFALRYGAVDEQILYVSNFSSFPHFCAGCARRREGRESLRSMIGLVGTTFLYVGRLWAGKGVKYLLDAFAVLQRRLDEKVSLVLAGDGPEEANLREVCKQKGISNVFFVGFKQREEIPALYAASDVFVFPTLGDPFGQVVEEAMSCSLPVISTERAGEIRDRLTDGVEGFIVPPGNSAALLDRMERLVLDSDLRRRMGEASVRRVARNTPEHWAQQFEDAVSSVLTSGGSPAG